MPGAESGAFGPERPPHDGGWSFRGRSPSSGMNLPEHATPGNGRIVQLSSGQIIAWMHAGPFEARNRSGGFDPRGTENPLHGCCVSLVVERISRHRRNPDAMRGILRHRACRWPRGPGRRRGVRRQAASATERNLRQGRAAICVVGLSRHGERSEDGTLAFCKIHPPGAADCVDGCAISGRRATYVLST